MKRAISIYFRKSDGIYIIPLGLTTQGFSYETEPFEFLPIDSDIKAIWDAAQKALENTNRVVPHPTDWNVITPWMVKAGVKKWRDFASKAKALGLDEQEDEIVLSVLRWDGHGFEGMRELKRTVRKSAPLEEKLTAFEKCLDHAKQQ